MSQVAEPRVNYIVSQTHNIEILLTELRSFEKRVGYKYLSEHTSLRGGTHSATLADIKILGLVSNNIGITISEDGIKFLENKDIAARKEFFLRPKYFAEMHQRDIKSFSEARKFLIDKLKNYKYKVTTLEHMASLAARRYVEFIFNAQISRRKGRRIIAKEAQKTLASRSNYLEVLGNNLTSDELKAVFIHLLHDEKSPINKEKRHQLLDKILP